MRSRFQRWGVNRGSLEERNQCLRQMARGVPTLQEREAIIYRNIWGGRGETAEKRGGGFALGGNEKQRRFFIRPQIGRLGISASDHGFVGKKKFSCLLKNEKGSEENPISEGGELEWVWVSGGDFFRLGCCF